MDKKNITDLETLLQEILVDTCGDEEQIWAILQYVEDHLAFPADSFVVGEPVSVFGIDYSGNIRQGLMASCRKESGKQYEIAAVDLVFPADSKGSIVMAVYRYWMGLEPFPEDASVQKSGNRHKATEENLNMSKSVELIVVSVKQTACLCLLAETKSSITFRTGSLDQTVPGWIITVDPDKQWHFSGHPYLSGKITDVYLDVVKLGLRPLDLEHLGDWDPEAEYWRDEEGPFDSWVQAVMAWGVRPQYEMEQILPGLDKEDPFSDPIIEASELSRAGNTSEARQLLMQLLETDMRCLDAYAHLGNMEFDYSPESAIKYFEAGMRIGELSLEDGFIGLLPWGLIDNRPFLRCLCGYGFCLWRLDQFEEAAAVFDHLLWLNPADNQGVRFGLAEVKSGKPWKPE